MIQKYSEKAASPKKRKKREKQKRKRTQAVMQGHQAKQRQRKDTMSLAQFCYIRRSKSDGVSTTTTVVVILELAIKQITDFKRQERQGKSLCFLICMVITSHIAEYG